MKTLCRIGSLMLPGLLFGTAAQAAPPPASPEKSPPAVAVLVQVFPGFGNPLQLTPHHLTMSVANVDRAVEWYRTKLGFEVERRGAIGTGANEVPFAELRISNFGVAFIQARGEPQALVNVPGRPVVPRVVHMVFAVPDPQATYDLLKSRGVAVYTRPAQLTDPISIFSFPDSEGHDIEIVKADHP